MSSAELGNGAESRLRIAYLLQQFPIPTETFAISDIAALRSQGHEVTVYTLKPPRRHEKAMEARSKVPAGLVIHRPSIRGTLRWSTILWRRRRLAAILVRRVIPNLRSNPVAASQALLCLPRIIEITDQIIRQQYDVVHAFWSRHVGLVLPALESDGAGPVRSSFIGAYDLVADDFILDATARAAEILFSHAEVNRPFLRQKVAPGAAIAIVHRGIPLLSLEPDDSRDPFRLMTASALVRSKNVEAVIRSFAQAHMGDSRLTLDIYGDGPDRPRLARLAEDLGCKNAMTFAGHVSRDELFARMQRTSVFLLLSKKASERLPNVVKEALWAGCAVVSSNSEGIEELLPDPGIGLVVGPDDQEAITSAIQHYLSESTGDAQSRRARSREFIAENFSSDASMRCYVEAWRKCLRPRRV